MSKHQELLQEFRQFAATASTVSALMRHISQRLHDQMARYNWVGFYLVDPADPGMLVVGPYVGSFSPNVRIPINIVRRCSHHPPDRGSERRCQRSAISRRIGNCEGEHGGPDPGQECAGGGAGH